MNENNKTGDNGKPRLTHDGNPLGPGEIEVAEFAPDGIRWVIYRAVMDSQATSSRGAILEGYDIYRSSGLGPAPEEK